MIHLQMTRQESDFLLHWLQNSVDSSRSCPEIQSVLRQKVLAAQQAARQPQVCSVCGVTFAQLTTGRTGRYCSHACRQKAYRQRRIDSLRRGYPPPRP